jgi:hypothetical protein
VTCPYCSLPLGADQAAVKRGDFLAHAGCQAEFERVCVYLTDNGAMVVGSARLSPAEAARLIHLVAKAKRKQREEDKDELGASNPPVSFKKQSWRHFLESSLLMTTRS